MVSTRQSIDWWSHFNLLHHVQIGGETKQLDTPTLLNKIMCMPWKNKEGKIWSTLQMLCSWCHWCGNSICVCIVSFVHLNFEKKNTVDSFKNFFLWFMFNTRSHVTGIIIIIDLTRCTDLYLLTHEVTTHDTNNMGNWSDLPYSRSSLFLNCYRINK